MVLAYVCSLRPDRWASGAAHRAVASAHSGNGAATPVIRRILVCASAAVAAFLPTGAPPARAAEPQGMELRTLTFVASRGGERDLVLHAERARYFPDTNVTYLERVHSMVDPREGQPGIEIECDRGELFLATNDFVATGNVRGRTADGRKFTTTWLRYDQKTDVAFTDAPVVIEEAGGTYTGGGFRYHVREQRFRLLGGASVVREP